MAHLDFEADHILENKTVVLRPLEIGDLEHLLPFSINEPELWTYSLTSAAGKENMESYVQMALEERASRKSYPFIVFDKRNNRFAGCTRFYDLQLFHETTQLGYTWYGKDFQGTGLNKNCKLLMLEFAFETIGLQRVEFRADNRNQRSIAAMKSIGCQEEGVLRSNCKSQEGRRDSIVLSILRDEWMQTVKNKLSETVRRGNEL